jgi:hypothetical protein
METKIFVLHADNDCQNHNKAVGYKIYSLYVLRKQINLAKAKQWFKSKKIMPRPTWKLYLFHLNT